MPVVESIAIDSRASDISISVLGVYTYLSGREWTNLIILLSSFCKNKY